MVIKNTLVQKLIYKTTHARRFIKTARLWEFFYRPAHARLRIKETEAGKCTLNYIAHIHCSCKIMYRMRRCIYYFSMVFSKDIFGAIYMEYITGFVPIRYRGYCLCISPRLILIYLQARVFQQFSFCPSC
jgi:hypothetical protein